jgi:hypothetical protein
MTFFEVNVDDRDSFRFSNNANVRIMARGPFDKSPGRI